MVKFSRPQTQFKEFNKIVAGFERVPLLSDNRPTNAEVGMTLKTLLIVDDEQEIIFVLKEIFQEAKWEVLSAENGVEALEICRAKNPSVILSDIQMPDMDGLTFLEKVFSQGEDTPVILLSAYRDADKMQRAWESCVYDFIDKPFHANNIVAVVESAREFGAEYVRTARKRFLKIRSAGKVA